MKQNEERITIYRRQQLFGGEKTRYDGSGYHDKAFEPYKGCFHFCPEVLGGLSVPRVPCKIDNGDGFDVLLGKAKILGADGKDYTDAFLDGAQKALEALLDREIRRVILKENSPSCGVCRIYNAGTLRAGMGVTAALLQSAGIEVMSEEELDEQRIGGR